MIDAEYCTVCGILWVRAGEPFALDELLDGAREEAVAAGISKALGNPVLLDFRSVSLVKFSAEDFRRVIRKRLDFSQEHTEVPYALIASSDADFGMLRMYATYAEIAGLRSAQNTYVTRNFVEGMQWLRSKSQCTNGDRCLTRDHVKTISQLD